MKNIFPPNIFPLILSSAVSLLTHLLQGQLANSLKNFKQLQRFQLLGSLDPKGASRGTSALVLIGPRVFLF